MSRTNFKQQLMKEQLLQEEMRSLKVGSSSSSTSSSISTITTSSSSTTTNTTTSNNNTQQQNHNHIGKSNDQIRTSSAAISIQQSTGNHIPHQASQPMVINFNNQQPQPVNIYGGLSLPLDLFTNVNTDLNNSHLFSLQQNNQTSLPPLTNSINNQQLDLNTFGASLFNRNVVQQQKLYQQQGTSPKTASAISNPQQPSSPFPLSPESPISGGRPSSASEFDDFEGICLDPINNIDDIDNISATIHDIDNISATEHYFQNNNQSLMEHESKTIPRTLPDRIDSFLTSNQNHHHQNLMSPGSTRTNDSSNNSQSSPVAIKSTIINVPKLFGRSATSSQKLAGNGMQHTVSSSCPQLSEQELKAWQKDRQKKDNHNQIERRRRYNINDRIKELGALLPRNADDSKHYELVKDMKQNKGTILKASVDYVKLLKQENTRLNDEKDRLLNESRKNQEENLRLQEVICALVKKINTTEHMPIDSIVNNFLILLFLIYNLCFRYRK